MVLDGKVPAAAFTARYNWWTRTFWKPGNSLCAEVHGAMSCYNKPRRVPLVWMSMV